MIEMSQIRVPAGAAGKFSSPGSTFCADSFGYPFHRRVTAEYVKDPGHSARSAGGRLQLQHACTLRMCHGMKRHWTCACLNGVNRTDAETATAFQVDHFAGYSSIGELTLGPFSCQLSPGGDVLVRTILDGSG